ncbi:MAG: hypothetical protein M3128_10990 [Verrucomicrobiota bacterium]|nr:hypothetical protein [Verrucomicrobiota bacterium]
MKRFAALLLLLVAGCGGNEPAPKIEALQFPVAVLFGNASTLLCKGRGQLTNMHSNYLTLNNEAPTLIDSGFKIYSLDRFRSVHSGLWLMANPSGVTDVTFELKTQKSGREIARDLFAHHLEKQTWLRDLPAKQKELAARKRCSRWWPWCSGAKTSRVTAA